MTDPVYDPIASFVGQLAASGVRDVVISPGSRSTPLALSFHAHPSLRTHVQLDERSAGFFALGQARASGRPSVLVCTSGTAAANYLSAVVEANHACVPMIVCTADRPPELRGWGAGQTIDQVGMYGTNVRWFADLPIPSDWSEPAASMAAMRAVEMSTGPRRGPVHLNWPLRKPLEPVGDVPVRLMEPVVPSRSSAVPPTLDLGDVERGLIIVGPDAAEGIDAQIAVAEAACAYGDVRGWPVIGEPLSQTRMFDSALAAGVHILEHADESLRPELVIRVGGAPTASVVNRWLTQVRPDRVVTIDPEQRWADASFTTTSHVAVDPAALFAAAAAELPDPNSDGSGREWIEHWRSLDAAAVAAIENTIAAGPRSSASVVRDLTAALPEGAAVMVSNSMPVRDVDGHVPVPVSAAFVGNRGASGIDGIISTGLGIATRIGGPVVVFTGDLALLHDIGGLLGVARSGEHLTVLCVDNDGGQIFSMLPINGRIDPDDYRTLFHTPHGVDFETLDGLAGVRVHRIDEHDALSSTLRDAVASTEPGVDLVLVRIDPEHDMAVRRDITTAVKQAIRP